MPAGGWRAGTGTMADTAPRRLPSAGGRTGRPAEAVAAFAGGAAGTLLRVALVVAMPVTAGQWPWPTLVANLLGAFLAGWFVTRLAGGPHSGRHPLLVTGFCGGLTTFSTLQIELLDLLDAGRTGTAAVYAGISIAAGMALFLVAVRLARPRRKRGGGR